MKSLVTALLMFATVPSFAAINIDSSWDQILGSHEHIAEFPQYKVGGNTFVPAYAVCVAGDKIVTTGLYTVCKKYASVGGDEAIRCIQEVQEHLTAPLTYTRQVCLEWKSSGDNVECVRYAKQKTTLKLSHEVAVYHKSPSYERDGILPLYPEFIKTFNVETCSK